MSGKNRLFKSGKTIRLRWDFCQSRISARFWKSAGFRPEPKSSTALQLFVNLRIISYEFSTDDNYDSCCVINMQVHELTWQSIFWKCTQQHMHNTMESGCQSRGESFCKLQQQSVSASTLLVGWQEGHPACKKTEWWDAGMVVYGSRCRLAYGPGDALPLTISCFSKSRLVLPSWFYLSGASSPGCLPDKIQESCKMVVCVCVTSLSTHKQSHKLLCPMK